MYITKKGKISKLRSGINVIAVCHQILFCGREVTNNFCSNVFFFYIFILHVYYRKKKCIEGHLMMHKIIAFFLLLFYPLSFSLKLVALFKDRNKKLYIYNNDKERKI
jgi:hypothetical protein